jgi:hypothetical protein
MVDGRMGEVKFLDLHLHLFVTSCHRQLASTAAESYGGAAE